jgi:DNA-binding response OmpR family regulator
VVFVAADGLEALRIAREQTLDMAVLDVMLLNLDGMEICRRLRRGTNIPYWRAKNRCRLAG